MIWRLAVIEKVATLHEIEEFWSLSDVFTACLILDVKSEIIGLLVTEVVDGVKKET